MVRRQRDKIWTLEKSWLKKKSQASTSIYASSQDLSRDLEIGSWKLSF